MTPDQLRQVRTGRFRESRRAFAARTGIPERTLARYEEPGAILPRWVGLVVAAVLYDLKPYGDQEAAE